MSDTRSSSEGAGAGSGRRSLPARIGHYRILGELGRGGMGTVYRAHEDSLNRDVAIKVLADHLIDDEIVSARFLREARTVAAISHPNLIHIYYTGSDDGQPYFVMEFVEGESLAERIVREQQLSPQRAAELLRQAASGLAAAHDRGLVHRDIKPSNLMLDRAGTLKVTDFGIALGRDFKEKLTTTGQFVGTSGYVSPEACKGQTVDARSDIFSLGIVLYEMLAGRMPFSGDSPLAMLVQVVEQPVPDVRELNPEVDGDLLRILDRMIEKNPDDRYQTCHELLVDVDAWLARTLGAVKQPAAKTQTLSSVPPARHRRQWPVALLVAALVLFAAGGSAWLLLPQVLDRRAPVEAAGQAAVTAAPDRAADAEAESARVGGEVPPETQALDSQALDSQASETHVSRTHVSETHVSEVTEPAGTGVPGQPDADQSPVTRPEAAETGPALATAGPDEVAVAAADDRASVTAGEDAVAGDSAQASSATLPVAPDSPATVPATERATGVVEPAAGMSPDRAAARVPAPAPAIPRLAMVTSGDPAVAGPIGTVVARALADTPYEMMDIAFIPGARDYIGDYDVDLGGLGERVRNEGGRLLVVASVTPIGATPLEYYGRHSLLYSARVELRAYDLLERRSLGGWSDEVRYTELNAAAQAEEVAAPLAAELAAAVRDSAPR